MGLTGFFSECDRVVCKRLNKRPVNIHGVGGRRSLGGIGEGYDRGRGRRWGMG